MEGLPPVCVQVLDLVWRVYHQSVLKCKILCGGSNTRVCRSVRSCVEGLPPECVKVLDLVWRVYHQSVLKC